MNVKETKKEKGMAQALKVLERIPSKLKLKPEIKEQWLEALRSGCYNQATHALRIGDSFCCLGVLCDLVNPGGWSENITKLPQNFCYDKASLPSLTMPPSRMAYDVLQPHEDPSRIDILASLTHLNDSGHTFAEIADFIEEHL